MLVMPIRMVTLTIICFSLLFFVTILSVGHDFKKGPMKSGCRKWMIASMFHIVTWLYLLIAGVSTKVTELENDYTYYLGPNYKEKERKIKRVSTIVSNHVSWIDPVVLIKTIQPAFSPSSEFRNIPVLNKLIDTLDSIYIPRGGSEENKAKALKAIGDRQKLIEETGRYAPFLIFAEGGTTNNTGIIKFKRGAFYSERTVRPIFMKYYYSTFSPSYDTIQFLPLLILHLSWACLKCTVNILPDFQPNEYLFETHKDKGKERWEIYAWAVRDIMMKAGNFD
jgi:1-acyl-sn-glycerol-3-phosphate acyltransferase